MSARGKPRSRLQLLRYHKGFDLENASIPHLKPESRRCIQNLAAYRAPKSKLRPPRARSSAVLVALFVGRMGDLHVLLSRRALTLRTYAGDTSLPGGRWEERDKTIEWTARREAFEEIGLPPDRQKVPLLCILEPFLAGNRLTVTPVVVLILDNTLRPVLNEPEVADLFSHPLAPLLSSESPFSDPELLEMHYHTYIDVDGAHPPGTKIRQHRFLTGREAGGTKPIFGITAAILIRVASIGYGVEPDFEVYAPGGHSLEQRIAYALKYDPVFRDAAVKEGINPDKTPDPSTLPGVGQDSGRRRRRRRVQAKL